MNRLVVGLIAWASAWARHAVRMGLLAASLSGVLWAAPANAADDAVEKVQITDPYIEIRTGPGRGYPIFFVVPREEWIEILSRHTDWFKVRASNGKLGWVIRQQLETTLTDAGSKKTFRDVALDDYLHRKLEIGAAWGRLKSEPMLKAWTGFRVSDTLSVEATIGQVQGTFSGSDFWHININAEPWSHQRLSPFFGIGLGKFKNVPNASLVGDFTTNVKMADAVVGLRYYVTERFVARTDYSIYTAYLNDNRTTEYRAITVGLSFFF